MATVVNSRQKPREEKVEGTSKTSKGIKRKKSWQMISTKGAQKKSNEIGLKD